MVLRVPITREIVLPLLRDHICSVFNSCVLFKDFIFTVAMMVTAAINISGITSDVGTTPNNLTIEIIKLSNVVLF